MKTLNSILFCAILCFGQLWCNSNASTDVLVTDLKVRGDEIAAQVNQLQGEAGTTLSNPPRKERMRYSMGWSGPMGRKLDLIRTVMGRREAEDDHGDSHDDSLGVHFPVRDLYYTIIFLVAIYVGGRLAEIVGTPALAGEIIVGIALGPPAADFVPIEEALVLFGDIGLVMLILEAGIDIDLAQLKATGSRAFVMAMVGIAVPLLIGYGLGSAAGLEFEAAFAVGACFAPTSLGVAAKALNAGNLLNSPMGQLIVATCIIDDIIGLVLLSEVEALVNPSPWNFIAPILSAFGFLFVLGWSAVTWMPKVIEHKYLAYFNEEHREDAAFGLMVALLLGYLPLLYATKASYLMGAFLAGLTFSQIGVVHSSFVHNTEATMGWLVRIFFATTIGFQVPVQYFERAEVISWGFLYYLAVLGKTVVGTLVPTLEKSIKKEQSFDPHLRDCIMVGIAMTCRGEFSFIIAAFAVEEELFDNETYASIVFAVLLSSITSPYVLLRVINYYNELSSKQLEEKIINLDMETRQIPLYINIQSLTGLVWGVQEKIKNTVNTLKLSVIDQRQWHPRDVNSNFINELYVKDATITVTSPHFVKEMTPEELKAEKERITRRCEEIRAAFYVAIGSATAEIKVTQWVPYAIIDSNTDDLDPDDFQQVIEEEAGHQLSNHKEVDERIDSTKGRMSTRVKCLSSRNVMTFKEFESIVPEKRLASTIIPRKGRSRQVSVPFLASAWGQNDAAKNTLRSSVQIVPMSTTIDTAGFNTTVRRRTRYKTRVMDLVSMEESIPPIESLLGGLVRGENDGDITEIDNIAPLLEEGSDSD